MQICPRKSMTALKIGVFHCNYGTLTIIHWVWFEPLQTNIKKLQNVFHMNQRKEKLFQNHKIVSGVTMKKTWKKIIWNNVVDLWFQSVFIASFALSY